MGQASTTRRLAALAALVGAGVGVLALADWQRAGWSRTAFTPDFGGPVAPLAAYLFVALGVSLAILALAEAGPRIRRGAGAVSVVTLVLMVVVVIRSNFRTPDFVEWRSGSPELWGPVPVGAMSPVAATCFVLTAVGLLDFLGAFARLPTLSVLTALNPLIAAALSVFALFAYASGPPLATGERLIPISLHASLAFAALNSSVLLLGLWPRLRHRWESGVPSDARRARGALLGQLGLAVISVGVLMALTALLSLRRAQASASVAAREQLGAIAELKAAQVAEWRREREREGRFLMRAPGVAGDIRDLSLDPSDARIRARVLRWLEPIRAGESYESARVFNARGELLLSTPPELPAASRAAPRALGAALSGSDALLTNPHPGSGPNIWGDFNLIVPLRFEGGQGKKMEGRAAIVLNIDPRHVLFFLLQQWPGLSPTGEVNLLQREGNGITYLNDLRTPLAATDRIRPAAPELAVPDRLFPVRDYRGVMSFAVTRPVPSSAWIVEAKMDQAEVYDRVRTEALRSGGLVGLLVLSAALAAVFAWRERRAGFLERALEAERRGSALAQRLALVTENANDVILLLDASTRIVEANERVKAFYGYSPEEMRAMSLEHLHPPATRPIAAGVFQRVFGGIGDGGVFETRHLKRDGSLLPVEVSARPVSIGEARYQLAIVRDITQRKAHEAEIERLNRLYAALSMVNGAIVRSPDRDAFLQDVCRCLFEPGDFPMAWIAWRSPSGTIEPVAQCGDRNNHLAQVQEWMLGGNTGPAGRAMATNQPFSCLGREDDPAIRAWHASLSASGFKSALSVPIRVDGSAEGALSVYSGEEGAFGVREATLLDEVAKDVAFGLEYLSLRKRREEAEDALRHSEERLRLTIAGTGQGLLDRDLRTGRIQVTPEYARMLGFDPAEFVETQDSWLERLHPEDREATVALFRECTHGPREGYRAEYRLRAADGGYRWILSLGRVVAREADGTAQRMVGTHIDITARKASEAAATAAQNRVAAVIEAVPDLLFELDIDGRYVSVHAGEPDQLIAPAGTIVGRTVSEVLPEAAAEEVMQALREAHERGSSLGRQVLLELPQGTSCFEMSVARMRPARGERPRFVVLSRNITARRQAEDAIRDSLREKEALLKEVHHRVKNNLQVITSLLRLETSRSRDEGTRNVLKEMQGRIRSMALLHESLYRTQDFARVDLADYLRQLASQLLRAHNSDPERIRLKLDLASVALAIDQAIPCGLIVNELMTNALKYAFTDGRAGEVRVSLEARPDGLMRLTVSDTGPGLPPDFDARKSASLGLQLISDLTRQIGGTLTVESPPACFTVDFPLPHRRSTGEIPSLPPS